jgi:SAM-dependent methyltransferase
MRTAIVQGTLWGARPEDWADNEAMCTPFYDAVFDAAAVGPQTRLLDLGCGAGTALLLAAQRGATVAGIDASAGMLATARRRLPGTDLRHGDIEQLPHPSGSFDVVTAFNTIGFCDEQIAALREAKRVTAPGGRVGVVEWGDPARCEMRYLFAALGPLQPAPLAGVPPRARQPIEQAMAEAGLTVHITGEVDTPLIFPDLATAIRIQSSSGPARLAAEHSGEQATRDAIAEAFSQVRRPDGTYRMNNVFRYLVATVE